MASRNYPEPAPRYPTSTTSGPGGQTIPAAYSHPGHHHQLPAYPQHDIQHGYAQHPAGSQPQVWRGDWSQGYPAHPAGYGHPNGQVSNASNPPQIPVARTLEKVYSFVPIPGAQQHKRPRRRYEEIERMYKCGWNGCEKAYGTLNHLNAHVTMQSHGQKRTPEEFKEIRKEWKARKKEEEAQKKAAAERERERLAAEQASQSTQLLDHQQGQPQQSQAPQQSIQTTAQRGIPSSQAYGAPRQLPPISNYGSPATSAVHYASPTAAPIDQMQQFSGSMYGNYPQAAYNQQSIYTQPGQPSTVAVAANSRMVPAGATNGDEQDGVTEGDNEVVNNNYAS